MKRTLALTTVALSAIALAGCAQATPETQPLVVATTQPTATATPAPLDGSGGVGVSADIAGALDAAGFAPRAFSSTEDLLSVTFPGLTATEPACLQPFGSDWAADPALTNAAMGWGQTSDHTMAAAVTRTSSADAASALVDSLRTAVQTCAATEAGFAVHDRTVDLTVQEVDPTVPGADASTGWSASTTIGGTQYTLVGATARVGDDVVIVLSTAPKTTLNDVSAKLEQLTASF